jgi:hypothetical protein
LPLGDNFALGIFVGYLVYFSPVLGSVTEKNLATLHRYDYNNALATYTVVLVEGDHGLESLVYHKLERRVTYIPSLLEPRNEFFICKNDFKHLPWWRGIVVTVFAIGSEDCGVESHQGSDF